MQSSFRVDHAFEGKKAAVVHRLTRCLKYQITLKIKTVSETWLLPGRLQIEIGIKNSKTPYNSAGSPFLLYFPDRHSEKNPEFLLSHFHST